MARMTKLAKEEFVRNIERIEPSIIEKMIRVGAFNLGCGCWYDEILIEKGFEIPNLTYTAFLRRLICAISGERYVFSCEEWACPVTYAKCRDFIETYNQVLISKPWMLDVFSEAQTKSFVTEVLDEYLPPKESEVLQLRFGFVDGKSWNLKEVGDKIGKSRERARQIEVKAMRHLRHSSKYKVVSEWYYSNASEQITDELKLVTSDLASKAEKTYEMLRSLEDVMTELKKNPAYLESETARKTLYSIKSGSSINLGTVGIRIADLDLGLRTQSCLARAQIHTVGDLLDMSRTDLGKVRNLGHKCAAEVEAKLLELGFELRD